MVLQQIVILALSCALLCNVNLSICDQPKENSETGNVKPQTIQPGNKDCDDQHGWMIGDDDFMNPVTVPSNVCGLCPTGPHDLEQCECTTRVIHQHGQINISCNASTGWTTVDEIREMFSSVDEYPTTTVFRFNMTGTKVSGELNQHTWGPLNFNQVIMNDNKIGVVDKHAFSASSETLTVLSLKNNDIYFFAWEHLEELQVLYTLELQGNNINFIPTEAFPFSGIAYLDLSRNVINSIGEGAFDKLHNLRLLNLSHNKLTYLSEYMFSILFHSPKNFNDLQINLSHNQIESLSVNAFADVHPVVIDLSHNRLQTVKQDIFLPIIQYNNNRIHIDLTGNPIVCNCDLYWIDYERGIFTDFDCFDESGKPMGVTFEDLDESFFENCEEPWEWINP